MSRVVLVTGGARSGKSRFAETRLRELTAHSTSSTGSSALPRLYVATAEPLDDEMRARISRHRAARGDDWRTIEEPRDLAATIAREGPRSSAVLVDCVTLWLTNLMLDGASDETLLSYAEEVAQACGSLSAPTILVTNEVGAGIVPDHPLGRRFRDVAGLVNQCLAAAADEVVLMACGLPLHLRESG